MASPSMKQRLRDFVRQREPRHRRWLAMDDFGTGCSSHGYRQKFRFDKIKIDRSFTSRLDQDPNADAIARAVVGMAEALGARANAEGVEASTRPTCSAPRDVPKPKAISIAARCPARRSMSW